MLKKSVVLFYLLLSCSFSFASEAGAPSASDQKEADPSNKLEVESEIQTDLGNLRTLQANAKAMGATFLGDSVYATLEKMTAKYIGSKAACVDRQAAAAKVCLESLSPDIANTTAGINMLVSAISTVAVKDACSNFAKAMDIAKAGMSAYTSACGIMRAGCGTSCVASKTGLEGMKTSLAALVKLSPAFKCPEGSTTCNVAGFNSAFSGWVSSMVALVDQELNKAETKSIAGKASLCVDKYATLLASGVMGIASLANSLKQGQDCGDATDGSGTTTPDLTNLDVKCAMDEYKNTSECICHLNPRQTGCVNSLEKTGSGSSYGSMNAGSGSGITGTDGSVTLPTGGTSTMPEIANKSGSSAGAGAPVGGGSGIGGGGSSSPGGGAGGEGEHKGLNTNILAGSGGGGGGGFGGGYNGAADAKYRPYLPGGSKDPQRGLAGQSISNEVTGQGGKSNWEKVRDRYRDNNNTLLSN